MHSIRIGYRSLYIRHMRSYVDMKLLVFYCAIVAANFIGINPQALANQPNPLLRTLMDALARDFFSVRDFRDLHALDLARHGIVRIEGTKSIVVNLALAKAALNQSPTKLSSYFDGDVFVDGTFVEFNYANAVTHNEDRDWEPLGKIKRNPANSTTNFGQGWGIGMTSGADIMVIFSNIIGAPQFDIGLAASSSTLGSFSCDVGPHKNLQFQIKAKYSTITNATRRQIRVVRNWRGVHTMSVGDFEEMEPITMMSSEGLQLACVTDPDYMR